MKIQVPTHINDMTLEQYQKFALIDDTDQEFAIHKTIEIFCGIDIQKVAKMRLKDAEELSKELLEVLDTNTSFENQFTLDGVKYGFIPDLEKMTLGEYIDLEDGLKDPKQYHKAMAVMFRPIKKEFGKLYTIEPYEASQQMHHIMKNAPLGTTSAAIVFFWRIVKESQTGLKGYMKKLGTEAKTILESLNSVPNTGGLTHSTLLAKETLQSIEQ